MTMPHQRFKPKLKDDYLVLDTESIRHSLANRLEYSAGKDLYTATERDWYHVASYVVRDRLMERWMETQRTYYRENANRVYYMSLEFLIGRTLVNSLINIGFADEFAAALRDINLDLAAIRKLDPDAGLGNVGIGRMAACFMDSIATMGLPGYGYGIR